MPAAHDAHESHPGDFGEIARHLTEVKSSGEASAEVRASGVAEILQKPVSVEELGRALARVLKG